MPTDIANFITANRPRFNRPDIDRKLDANALLRNEVARVPQRNRAEDLSIQAQEAQITEAGRQNAQGILGRNFSLIANSPRPREAARMFLSTPDFQQAGKLAGLPVEQFTITDQDTDDVVRQQAQAWADALSGVAGSAAPAGVQQFEHLTRGLSPEDKSRAARINLGLDSRAGQGRVTMVNNVPTWTGIGDDGQPFQIPLSSLQSEADAAGTVKEAEALGSGRGKAQAEYEAGAPQRAERARQQITQIDNVMAAIGTAEQNAGWSTIGTFGALTRAIPGTPAHDMQQTLMTIKANIGFDRLQQMREASPTGGALGQVAIQELDALQASIAALEQSQSGTQFVRNLGLVKQHYENWKQVIQRAQSAIPDFQQNGGGDIEALLNKYAPR